MFLAIELSLNIPSSALCGIKVGSLNHLKNMAQFGSRKTAQRCLIFQFTKRTEAARFKSKNKQFFYFEKEYYLKFYTEMTLN